MAIVKPFRGVRYNPERIQDMQTVVSQPYDRIGDALQNQYYELSPYNIVRIIQGKEYPGDQADGPNVYTRARDTYRQWLDQEIFIRESQPAVYAYEQTFTVDGKTYHRLGMIAGIQLAEFDEGIILPHERTHQGPKDDRLRLLTTLQAHTEQIFMLYPDPQNEVNALLRQAIGQRPPDVDVVELYENGVRQRMWVISDPAVLAAIETTMAPMRNLIIADGHHRYETALNYRNMQRPDPDAAFNYVAATLVSMDDPGLVILPTHREICNFTDTAPHTILERAADLFVIEPASDLANCLDRINSYPGYAFGFYDGSSFHVLTLKDDHLAGEYGSLAVSVLHKILLDQIAQVPLSGIEDKSMIRYHRDPQLAVDSVNRGEGNFVLLVSPTRIENIKAWAAQGAKMPQKSTDFYPKVISGLTLMSVAPDERL